jgi:cytochrome o ubiquinol oxidase subunit II
LANLRKPSTRAPLSVRLPILAASLALTGCTEGILNPQGPVTAAERELLFNSLGIMLTIVVPVILATLSFAWWFRASNTRARYLPTWSYSGKIEIVVWAIPAMVIILLGGIIWLSSHDLDPAKPIQANAPTIEVDVVALDWKWLFIYPQQGIASVNRMVVPAGAPVSIQMTSATVMNSFFVPQLASQIYAMAGMTTHLNLLADHPGQYPGLSAQFSGDGFSGMRFTLDAVPADQFNAWVSTTKSAGPTLDEAGYAALSKPSEYVKPSTYKAIDPMLFSRIATMKPAPSAPSAIPTCASSKGGPSCSAN